MLEEEKRRDEDERLERERTAEQVMIEAMKEQVRLRKEAAIASSRQGSGSDRGRTVSMIVMVMCLLVWS